MRSGLCGLAIYFPQLKRSDVDAFESANIQSSIVCEEIGISALSANACSASRAESVCYSLLAEGVGRHIIIAAVPGDVGLERIDHQVSIGGADRAVAMGHWAVLDRW